MIKFIESKFQRPDLGTNLIKRERLTQRLQNNLGLSATFVCAGPGWGKTTAAAEFIKSTPVPSVWYELDNSDADIAVFFRYLVRAIQQAGVDFGRSTLDLLSSGGASYQEQLADLFLYELSEAVKKELIVVLDNVHHIFSAEWTAQILQRILQLVPAGVHFILLARVAPAFTFSRLRSKQRMDQMDDRGLAFTRSEARELFEGSLDDPEPIDKLLGWTQGWVAGLQIIRRALAADPSLRQQEIEEIITRSESEIFEYFAQRVWNAEPHMVRDFLIRSSLPDHLTHEVLTEALGLNISNDQLQATVRENVFLNRLAGETDTYTYHPLFRDFLRKQLKTEISPEQLSDIHLRLGHYYALREDWGLALHHFFEAGDETTAARTMLAAEEPLLAGGLTRTVSSYFPRFGSNTLDVHPQLYNLMGEVRIIEGDSSGAEWWFQSALAAARISNDRPVEAAALAGLAHSAVRKHNFNQAKQYVEAAAPFTAFPDKNGVAVAARIKSVAGAVRVFEGCYSEAIALMEEALRLAHRAGDVRLIRSISHNLALPAFMEGDFHAALRYFSRSPISETPDGRRSLRPDSVSLYLNRAAVHTALGNMEMAECDLESAHEMATVFSLRGFVPRIIEARGNIARERGLFEKAHALYCAALQEYRNAGCDPAKSDLFYERALLELRRGELDRALELIDRMVSDREKTGREIELALARQMRARVLLERGDPRAIAETEASEPLLRKLQCNYYLAISCYLRSRALIGRDVENGRLALTEFLRLAERFDYSYFVRSEDSHHPAMLDLCRKYSVASAWLNMVLASASA
jgi:ATP/maltotriose-dependent transcriptional regulator MalT